MKLTILAGAAMLLPVASWAADIAFDVKPGLYETTSTMTMNGAAKPAAPQIPPEKLAQLPAAQRAQIEAMIKARGAGGGQPTVTKVCMTKESMAKALSFAQGRAECAQKVISQSANRQEVHSECTGQFKGSGDLIVERIDSEHAKGNMVMKGDSQGIPVSMTMSFTTKFVGEDCGDVKPFGQ